MIDFLVIRKHMLLTINKKITFGDLLTSDDSMNIDALIETSKGHVNKVFFNYYFIGMTEQFDEISVVIQLSSGY